MMGLIDILNFFLKGLDTPNKKLQRKEYPADLMTTKQQPSFTYSGKITGQTNDNENRCTYTIDDVVDVTAVSHEKLHEVRAELKQYINASTLATTLALFGIAWTSYKYNDDNQANSFLIGLFANLGLLGLSLYRTDQAQNELSQWNDPVAEVGKIRSECSHNFAKLMNINGIDGQYYFTNAEVQDNFFQALAYSEQQYQATMRTSNLVLKAHAIESFMTENPFRESWIEFAFGNQEHISIPNREIKTTCSHDTLQSIAEKVEEIKIDYLISKNENERKLEQIQRWRGEDPINSQLFLLFHPSNSLFSSRTEEDCSNNNVKVMQKYGMKISEVFEDYHHKACKMGGR